MKLKTHTYCIVEGVAVLLLMHGIKGPSMAELIKTGHGVIFLAAFAALAISIDIINDARVTAGRFARVGGGGRRFICWARPATPPTLFWEVHTTTSIDIRDARWVVNGWGDGCRLSRGNGEGCSGSKAKVYESNERRREAHGDSL